MEHIDGPWRGALATFLGIKTERSKPRTVDMSTIQPVIDTGFGGDPYLNSEYLLLHWKEATHGSDLEDVRSRSHYLVLPQSPEGLDESQHQHVLVSSGHHFVVYSCGYQIVTPLAERLNFQNRYFWVELQSNNPPYLEWHTMWYYKHSVDHLADGYYNRPGEHVIEGLPGGQRLPAPIVMVGCKLRLLISCADEISGGEMSFSDQFNLQSWVKGVEVPEGGPIPRFW